MLWKYRVIQSVCHIKVWFILPAYLKSYSSWCPWGSLTLGWDAAAEPCQKWLNSVQNLMASCKNKCRFKMETRKFLKFPFWPRMDFKYNPGHNFTGTVKKTGTQSFITTKSILVGSKTLGTLLEYGLVSGKSSKVKKKIYQ